MAGAVQIIFVLFLSLPPSAISLLFDLESSFSNNQYDCSAPAGKEEYFHGIKSSSLELY
jgi:hypothetical protein